MLDDLLEPFDHVRASTSKRTSTPGWRGGRSPLLGDDGREPRAFGD